MTTNTSALHSSFIAHTVTDDAKVLHMRVKYDLRRQCLINRQRAVRKQQQTCYASAQLEKTAGGTVWCRQECLPVVINPSLASRH